MNHKGASFMAYFLFLCVLTAGLFMLFPDKVPVEKLITQEQAVLRVTPAQLGELLYCNTFLIENKANLRIFLFMR